MEQPYPFSTRTERQLGRLTLQWNGMEPMEVFIPEYTESKEGPVHSSSAATPSKTGASRRPNRLGGCRHSALPPQRTAATLPCIQETWGEIP